MKQLALLAVSAFILLLSGCAHPTVSAAENERIVGSVLSPSDYKLGIDDRIRIIVYDEPSLSGEFQVGADGKLSFPLIGTVDAEGKTVSEVASTYETKLSDGYLVSPRVSAEIISYRPFFILGEVKSPGKYPYASGLTVMNAIATAAGFTNRAENKTVFIRRSGEAQEKAYPLTPDLMVLPGDTIRLGERFF